MRGCVVSGGILLVLLGTLSSYLHQYSSGEVLPIAVTGTDRVHMIHLQFSTERSIGSWVIRRVTWSDWSHVDVVTPNGDLLGARVDGGVQVRHRDYAPFTHTSILSIEVTDEQEHLIWKFLDEQIGKPYDWLGIVGIGLERDIHAADHWFCSELVAAAFEYAGIQIIYAPNNRVTPGLLYDSPLLHKVQ